MAITVNTGFDRVNKAHNIMFKKISDGLERKYEIPFELLAYNNQAIDQLLIVHVRCCPSDNPGVIFDAHFNPLTKEIEDDFPQRVANYQVADFARNTFLSRAITCLVEAQFICKSKESHLYGEPIESSISRDESPLVTLDVFVDEKQDYMALYSAIAQIIDEYSRMNPKVKVGVKSWVFDEKSISVIKESQGIYPDISETLLIELNPISSSVVSFLNGEISKDADQFCAELSRKN